MPNSGFLNSTVAVLYLSEIFFIHAEIVFLDLTLTYASKLFFGIF